MFLASTDEVAFAADWGSVAFVKSFDEASSVRQFGRVQYEIDNLLQLGAIRMSSLFQLFAILDRFCNLAERIAQESLAQVFVFRRAHQS